MRRKILASTAGVLVMGLALTLSGCSNGSSSSSGPVGVAEPGRVDPGAPADGGFAQDDSSAESADGSAAADQSVITTGWISVRVDDPIVAADQAVSLVAELDGRIDSRSQQAGSDDQRGSSSLTIRVPADSVDEAVERLRELGDVDSVSISASDVTLQVRDLDAQITALQASVDRLLALVGSAATTADLIELETAISDRQGQLDSLKSQQQYLADQIDYSTITLDLQQKGALPSAAPGDFWSGLATGWASLGAAASGLLVLAGVLIPWLLPLAVIAAVIVLAVTLTRRRPRRPAPAATPAAPTSAEPAPAPTPSE
ncbi:DUF4349 domain-containing protein [Herbiconiux sp. P18]|uniref:DUF4349 domain-containing protein n=1 Tax=Herbiconiux liangxiaofengii TaxID=3342795 RepID=UPI0035B8BD9C